jgi:hypothetical protein
MKTLFAATATFAALMLGAPIGAHAAHLGYPGEVTDEMVAGLGPTQPVDEHKRLVTAWHVMNDVL